MSLLFRFFVFLVSFSSEAKIDLTSDMVKSLEQFQSYKIQRISEVDSPLKNAKFYRVRFRPVQMISVMVVKSAGSVMLLPRNSFPKFSLFMNKFIMKETVTLKNLASAEDFVEGIYILFDPVPQKFICTKGAAKFICSSVSRPVITVELYPDGTFFKLL